jgi:hypothetical protein
MARYSRRTGKSDYTMVGCRVYFMNSASGSAMPLRTYSSRSVTGLQPKSVFAAVQSKRAVSVRVSQSR